MNVSSYLFTSNVSTISALYSGSPALFAFQGRLRHVGRLATSSRNSGNEARPVLCAVFTTAALFYRYFRLRDVRAWVFIAPRTDFQVRRGPERCTPSSQLRVIRTGNQRIVPATMLVDVNRGERDLDRAIVSKHFAIRVRSSLTQRCVPRVFILESALMRAIKRTRRG